MRILSLRSLCLWGRWTCWSSSRASPSRVEPLRRFADRHLPIRALLEQLTGLSVTRGALAAFRRPPLADPGAFLDGLVERADVRPVRVCVLEGIVDHSNVGAIFRSAAALNVDGILVSPTCVDPLYRRSARSARVSMGTVFQVPWTRIGSEARVWPYDGFEVLKGAGFTCSAMALSDDSVSLDDPSLFQVPWTRIGSEARVWPYDGFEVLKGAGFTCSAMALSDDSVSLDDPSLLDIERHAIFMGTEGAGLQAKTIAGCDKTIRIPMALSDDSVSLDDPSLLDIERHAIFMGTEGAGLQAKTIAGCDKTIRIPMAHGVDSLNVAAASAVAFWQLCPHVDNGYHYRPGMLV